MMVSNRNFRRGVHWSLVVLSIMVIVTGLGIAYFRPIEALTLGLLSKNLSFQLHSLLFIPFTVVLILHSLMSRILKNLS